MRRAAALLPSPLPARQSELLGAPGKGPREAVAGHLFFWRPRLLLQLLSQQSSKAAGIRRGGEEKAGRLGIAASSPQVHLSTRKLATVTFCLPRLASQTAAQ